MYIDAYRNVLTQLCLQNKVKSLYAFGSVLTNRFNSESEIFDFMPEKRNFLEFQKDLKTVKKKFGVL